MSYFYIHKTQYYETDQMGIIHHSNYIRWFEEARTAFMEENGYSYARLEAENVISPVLTAECEYRKMVHYGDTVKIEVIVEKFNGIKLVVGYRVFDLKTGELCTTGRTSHCFLNAAGRPISLKKEKEEFYRMFASALEKED